MVFNGRVKLMFRFIENRSRVECLSEIEVTECDLSTLGYSDNIFDNFIQLPGTSFVHAIMIKTSQI